MRIFFSILAISLFTLYTPCQELLCEQEVDLMSGFNDKRECLPVVDAENNRITLFLLDDNDIIGLQFDKNYMLINRIKAERPEIKFKDLLGHSINSKGFNLFFANSNKKKFILKTINFINNKSAEISIDIDFREEKYLESFSYNNKFYLLTVTKSSSKLNLYDFDDANNLQKHIIDLSEFSFSDLYSHELSYLLSDIVKIENENPNPLEISSRADKLYYFDDKLFLTIDYETVNTKLISIDLMNFNAEVKFVPQCRLEEEDEMSAESNSFLFGDRLFQLSVSKKELCLRAYDLERDSAINEYRAGFDEDITFLNSAIVQEGGGTVFTRNSERELEETKKILRRIAASDVGVSVYKMGNILELTIGGYKEWHPPSGGGMMMTPGPSMSTPYGPVSVGPTYSYNPTMYGYGSYTTSRAVSFKTLIETGNCKHVDREVKNNVFDNIRAYEEENKKHISTQTIFRLEDNFIFGYYDRSEMKYYLRKFGNDEM